MKIRSFRVGQMGALRGLALNFTERVSVITAPNEGGKTTFLDAIHIALYGQPRGNTVDGRRYAARYGAGPWDLSLDREGEVLPEETLKNVLTIRAGESRVNADANFLDRFASSVLGAGMRDLNAAIRVTSMIAVPPRSNSTWNSTPQSWREELAQLNDRLTTVMAGDAATLELAGLDAQLAGKRAEADAVGRGLKDLSALEASRRRERLVTLKATLDEAESNLLELRAPARPRLEELRRMQFEAREAGERRRRAEARLGDLQKSLAGAKADLNEAERASSVLKDPATLDSLRTAITELGRREAQAAVGAGGLSLGWIRGATAAAALAAGTIAYLGVHSAFTASICAVVAGAAVWFLLPLVSGASGSSAAKALDAARMAFKARRDALGEGWVGITAEAASARLEDEARKSFTARAQVAERAKRCEGIQSEVESLRKEAAASPIGPDPVAAELQTYGAADLELLSDRVSRREGLEVSLARLRSDAVRELGRAVAPTEISVSLRAAVDGLNSEADRAPRDLAGMPPAEASVRLEESRRRWEQLSQEVDRLQAHSRDLSAQVARASDRQGLSAGALAVKIRLYETVLGEVELYRRAASIAGQELTALQEDNAAVIRDCVAEAARLLPKLTDGRYTGLTLTGPLDKEAPFTVTHRDLGDQPFPWMSSGAQDCVWLALRLALAKRACPEGSVLILDEPFRDLDPERTLAAMKVLASAEDQPGFQIIILTKDPAVAETMAQAGLLQPAGRFTLRHEN